MNDQIARFREIAKKSAAMTVAQKGGGFSNLVHAAAGSPYNNAPGRTNYHRFEQYGMLQGTPYTPIRLIANRLASQTVHVSRRAPVGRKFSERVCAKGYLPECLKADARFLKPLDDHPILRVLRNPNPLMLSYALYLVTFMGLEVFGEYYWWMDKTDLGNGRYKGQVWPVPPHWIREAYDNKGNLIADKMVIQPYGTFEGKTVPIGQIVPFKYPDCFDPFGILSPMQAAARNVSIDAAGELAMEANLRNGANPGLAIIAGRPSDLVGATGLGEQSMTLTGDQRDELMSWFRERYQGFMRGGEPLILDGLIKDVKQINGSLNQIDISPWAEYNEGKILRIFGVNRISAGDVHDANRASASVADDHFVNAAIQPRTTMLDQTLTKYMGDYFADDKGPVEVYSEIRRQGDDDLKLAKNIAYLDRGVKSRNEVRAEEGLQPIEGGDEARLQGTSNGDQWVPVRVRDEGELPQGTPGGGKATLGGYSSSEGNAHGQYAKPSEFGGHHHYKPSERMWRLTLKAKAKSSEEFRERIENLIRSPLRVWTRSAFKAAKRKLLDVKGGEHGLTLLRAAWPVAELHADLTKTIRPVIESAALAAMEHEWASYKASKDDDATFKDAKLDGDMMKAMFAKAEGTIARAVNAVGRVVVKVWNWLKRRFLGRVADKTADREGVPVPADAPTAVEEAARETAREDLLQEKAKEVADDKAGADATFVFNDSRNIVIDTLSKTGKVLYRVWRSKRPKDGRTRDTHDEADGQRCLPGEKFQVGGHACDFPGDPTLPASERIHCLLPGNVVEGRVQFATRSGYSGEAIEIVTAAGRRLTLTPNHPVLAEGGWVRAGELDRGQKLLSHGPHVQLSSVNVRGEYVDNMPTAIEKVFEAGLLAGAVEVRDPHSEDFHGDSRFFDGQVEVVFADRKLWSNAMAGRLKKNADDSFVGLNVRAAQVSRQSPLLARAGGVGFRASGGPSLLALPGDGGGIGLEFGPLDPLRLGAASRLDTGFSEDAKNDGAATAELFRDLQDRYFGLVKTDDIVRVNRFHFSGHVYDLQCSDGLIVSNGIYISNCRCIDIAVYG